MMAAAILVASKLLVLMLLAAWSVYAIDLDSDGDNDVLSASAMLMIK
jgi:hypothetical protein